MTSGLKCPHCGLFNPESAQRCDCGYDFKIGTVQESYLKLNPDKVTSRKQVLHSADQFFDDAIATWRMVWAKAPVKRWLIAGMAWHVGLIFWFVVSGSFRAQIAEFERHHNGRPGGTVWGSALTALAMSLFLPALLGGLAVLGEESKQNSLYARIFFWVSIPIAPIMQLLWFA